MTTKFKGFDGIGVELSIGNEVHSTKYFTSMKEAAEYFFEKQAKGFKCRFLTVNEWGIEIEDIT